MILDFGILMCTTFSTFTASAAARNRDARHRALMLHIALGYGPTFPYGWKVIREKDDFSAGQIQVKVRSKAGQIEVI